jgi:uncharacterized membrane protein YidH (DUF202 family)
MTDDPRQNRRARLQAERTALAWTRTALTAAALAGVTLKDAIHLHAPAEIVSAACAVGGTLALYICGRVRTSVPVPTGSRSVVRTLQMAVAACLIANAAAALAIALDAL